MFAVAAEPIAADKKMQYRHLLDQARALFEGESDSLANAANLAALLYHGLPELNWAGFYFRRGTDLVLGPFQGRPACVRIPLGSGVCGTAAHRGEVQCVTDVNAFPGHIACDAHSRSEIVIPLRRGGEVIGVLDLDSPKLARFDAQDESGLTALAALWLEMSRTAV